LREPQGTDLVESAPRQAERPLQEGVRVRPTEAGDATQARLTEAYDALQRRDLERARTLYESVIAADDRNIDGMLGLAATSWQQGQADRASDQYYRVLQLDPQNAAAPAGLIGLSGQVDPVASESRLKQLIARDPSALLYASLGHLHASQSQWSNAQQAYFQAHQLEPTNPDYAYNLAVGLEHVGQRGIAVGYYRKALDLARARGRAGFDADQVTARVAKLSAAVE
jgi:Tfp pilus assembly protein PilF